MKQYFALCAAMWVGACGDPLAEMPRYSDADVSDDPALLGVAAAPTPEKERKGGFLSQLLGDAPAQDPSETVEDVPGEAAIAEQDTTLPPESYGVTSRLPDAEPEARGLFGLFKKTPAPAGAQTATSVPPGARLPYGKVAVACDVAKGDMGKRVAQYPEKRPRHQLYDTDPGNTAPHTFYLTGFADGCARQFTASLAIFGSVGMHEQLRYGLPAEVQPYSHTDKAYEKVKSKVCGVPRKKPCGAKLNRLENGTVFLSIYESFGDIDRWSNLLLHDGQLLASDIKG